MLTETSSKIECSRRDSSLELYRILLMLAIIAHHYVVNSGLMELMETSPRSGNTLFLLLFGAWGKTGINCFLLITGYFMCQSQITLKKFAKLFFEVKFYAIVFSILFYIAGYTSFSWKAIIKGCFPVSSVTTNFVHCFLVFFLLIPFLNILIRHMSKRQHQLLIALLLFVYTILPSLGMPVSLNYVTWFSVLYFISSYVRCYPNRWFENTRLWGVASIMALLFSLSSIVIICSLRGSGWLCYFFLSDSNKILAVMTSISLFLFFKNWHLGYSKWINIVAQSVFGVLLIHANSDAMRQWLWQDTLQNPAMFDSEWLWVHAIVSVVAVFVICTVLDQGRIHLIERPFFKFWDTTLEKKIITLGNKIGL